jgi:DNA-binding MarR family transcriptional regulator
MTPESRVLESLAVDAWRSRRQIRERSYLRVSQNDVALRRLVELGLVEETRFQTTYWYRKVAA